MGSHYVYNIVPYIHVIACSMAFKYVNFGKCRVVGKYVNLKKSVSDMYAGLKFYDTIIIWLIYYYIGITQRDGSH
jgi:hypothetical protein